MSTEPPSKIYELALSDILIDDKLQVRRRLNEAAITNYTAIYKSGGAMPPLRVARVPSGALILVDGWHRVAALRRLEVGRASVEIIETSERGARWEAARANLKHGVPLKNGEYREVFRAYVSARQHRGRNGKLKSYRDIAHDIGGTRAYTTIRNWMLADFPRIAEDMGGGDVAGSGGLQDLERIHPEDDLLAAGLTGADNAAAAARGICDPSRRGQLVEKLTEALRIAKEAGPYEPPNDDF